MSEKNLEKIKNTLRTAYEIAKKRAEDAWELFETDGSETQLWQAYYEAGARDAIEQIMKGFGEIGDD